MDRKQARMCIAVALVVGAVCACSKSPEQSEKPQAKQAAPPRLIGKWCYKPSMIQSTWDMFEIRRDSDYSLIDRFGDGSTLTRTLSQNAGALWIKDENETGDRYILPANKGGELIIADNQGEIGRAQWLSPTATTKDCFNN